MKFHDRQTSLDTAVKLGLLPKDYGLKDLSRIASLFPRTMANQIGYEHNWIIDKRPYYNIWPSIVEPLRRTRLDVPGDQIHLPRNPILLRFAEGKELEVEGVQCRSVLASEIEVIEDDEERTRGVCLWCDFGEYQCIEDFEFMVCTYRVFRLSGMTVQEGLDSSSKRFDPITQNEEKLLNEIVKIVIAVALMNEDEDFFTPDVLGKDRAVYGSADPERRKVIVERARRRGKFGWDVGKELHQTPHVVPPYFAVRWMGAKKGKPGSQAVLRPISGYVTHKKLITDVPTGYLENPS